MPRNATAFAVVVLAILGASPGRAQEPEAVATPPTAEEMIEIAREVYRPPGLPRRCRPGKAGEIVVCASDPNDQRVPSSTDEAIAAGQALPDGHPRTPDLFGIPEGGVTVAHGCFVPPCPRPMPPLIDLAAIPEPLTPEEAALVFRAEDQPSPDLSPAAASPAAAP